MNPSAVQSRDHLTIDVMRPLEYGGIAQRVGEFFIVLIPTSKYSADETCIITRIGQGKLQEHNAP